MSERTEAVGKNLKDEKCHMVHWKVKIGLVKGYMKRTAGAGALASVGARSLGSQDVTVSVAWMRKFS